MLVLTASLLVVIFCPAYRSIETITLDLFSSHWKICQNLRPKQMRRSPPGFQPTQDRRTERQTVTHHDRQELGLDNHFGAFVAGEERGVDPATMIHQGAWCNRFRDLRWRRMAQDHCTVGLQPAQLSEFLFKTALSSACTT
jgi:hypothetical protein